MKTWLKTVIALAILAMTGTANASTIGTEITVTRFVDGTISAGPIPVPVVVGGPELLAFGEWDIDIEDSSINLLCSVFSCGGDFFAVTDAYLFEGFDWGGTGFLSGAGLVENCTCFPDITFPTSTSIRVRFDAGTPAPQPGERILLELTPSHGTPPPPDPGPTTVPEPTTMTLFGIGIVGMGALTRRRRLV